MVEFSGSLDMMVVHSSWIIEESQTYCPPYWANASKVKKAVLQGELPNKESWKLYSTRILARSGEVFKWLILISDYESFMNSQ